MASEAFSYSTVELANSFNGKSGVFAVDFRVNAVVELTEERDISFIDESFSRFDFVARKTLDYLGLDSGCTVDVKTKVPADAGLGFDEAVSSAIMLAVCGVASSRGGALFELKIDKYVTEQLIDVGGRFVDLLDLVKTISCDALRFDRLFASCFGGFVIADNRGKEVLRRGEMESLYASIVFPDRLNMDVDESGGGFFSDVAEVIFMEALKGNLYAAMKLHGLFYSMAGMGKALSSGALTATACREGVVIALSRDKETAANISDLFFSVANHGARVVGRPKKIIKVNEFLRRKGDSGFYWI